MRIPIIDGPHLACLLIIMNVIPGARGPVGVEFAILEKAK
jgi:hypothetical protein